MADSKAKKQWTILELIQWTTEYFQSHGIESPRLTAELLLAHSLEVDRISLYTHYDKPLDAKELAAFREGIQRRVRREPTQYITGRQEFWSMEFTVTPDVLIPRPETELLVETALKLFGAPVVRGAERRAGGEDDQQALPAAPGSSPLTLADIGTGSGNIAIALAKELRDCIIYASDISEKALQVAGHNAKKLLESPDKIIFLKGDLLEPFDKLTEGGLNAASLYKDSPDLKTGRSSVPRDKGSSGKLRFHGILCNPPYISEEAYASLAPEVSRYEPKIALLGGRDGLDYYRRLLSASVRHLGEGGYLLVEIGFHQRDQILRLIERTSLLTCCEVIKDYAGIDRVVVARRKGGK